jgi:Protein of unknown function (DUF3833)
MMFTRILTAAAALLGLAGCAGPTPQTYAGGTPAMDLAEFFNGRVEAWGMVQERDGKVIRRMQVVMDCSWDGNTGTFDETFTYDDGGSEKRIWTVQKEGNRYSGTAADVVGEAHGEAVGHAFNWRYVLAYKGKDGVVKLDMDDWMWRIDARTVVNKTRFSKFGIGFGEVTLFFRKAE